MKKPSENTSPRSRFYFFGTPLGKILIIVWFGFVGLLIRNSIFLSETKDMAINRLKVEDSKLIFHELGRHEDLKVRDSVLATMPKPDISYEVQTDQGKSKIVVSSKGKKYLWSGDCSFGEIFADKKRTLLFAEVTSDDKNKTRIWRWTEKDGFKMLFERPGFVMELRLSADNETFGVMNIDLKREPSQHRFVTLSLDTLKVTDSDADIGDDLCSVLDKDNVLVSVLNIGLIYKREHDLFKLNVLTGAKTRFLPGLNPFDAVAFNGSTWCLCENQGKYSAVRLNSTNDKVEETIDLSKYVNRPWPKAGAKTASSER